MGLDVLEALAEFPSGLSVCGGMSEMNSGGEEMHFYPVSADGEGNV